MRVTLTDEVLQDDLAVVLACAVAAANKQARAGVDVDQSLITVTQHFENGPRWRVNYGTKDYTARRGGDLIVDVDAADGTVKRVLRGQ